MNRDGAGADCADDGAEAHVRAGRLAGCGPMTARSWRSSRLRRRRRGDGHRRERAGCAPTTARDCGAQGGGAVGDGSEMLR